MYYITIPNKRLAIVFRSVKWGKKNSWTHPSKVKEDALDASSNALIHVGPGRGFWPPFVPSQWLFPPKAVVTLWPVVVTVPSKIVVVDPSTRKLTEVGWFGTADENNASTATTVSENKWWWSILLFFLNVESSWVGSDWAAYFVWTVLNTSGFVALWPGTGQGINILQI